MNSKLITIIILFNIIFKPVYGLSTSPWEHQQPELTVSPSIIPGSAPVVYNISTFTREREMYGYNPRFFPNLVTFDNNNRPYIYVSVFENPGDNSTTYPYYSNSVNEAYIQTLDDNGTWIVYPVVNIIKDLLPNWNGNLYGGTSNCNERVVFDQGGDMYWTVHRTNPDTTLLFHSSDLKTWRAYTIGSWRWKLELFDSYNQTHLPPTIVSDYGGNGVWLVAPGKNPDGTLNNTNAINIGSNPEFFFAPPHSGGGNSALTVDNKSHIVFLSTAPSSQYANGTDQFYVSFDRNTRNASSPYYIGTTESGSGTADIHNGPAITIDSTEKMHVMLGSHQRPFKYTTSIDGYSWSSPVDVTNNQTPWETYIGMVTDHNDTMHLVARMVQPAQKTSQGVHCLHYMRKKTSDQAWVDCGEIVIPHRPQYAIYYHKLTIDRLGRLFLAYFYFTFITSEEERNEYIQKWPNDPDPNVETRAHDSVIIMSDDGGDSWRIATTDDFVNGIIHQNIVITPEKYVVDEGSTATFTASSGGSDNFEYQWKKSVDAQTDTPDDDITIGDDSNTLILDNVQVIDEGYYYCIASNDYGTKFSNIGMLMTKRLVSHWEFENNLNDSVSGYNGNRVNPEVYSSGIVGTKALQFDNDVDDTVYVTFQTLLNLPSFTVSAWVKPISSNSVYQGVISTRKLLLDGSAMGYVIYGTSQNIWSFWTGTGIGAWNKVNGPSVEPNEWVFLTATYDELTNIQELRINGSLYSSKSVGQVVQNDTYGLLIGAVFDNPGNSYVFPFNGLIDDVRYYNYVIDPEDIGHLYSDVTGEMVCTEPLEFDLNNDCLLNLADFVEFANSWQENNFVYPTQ